MFRDIRIIEIHAVVNNRRNNINKTKQCVLHKLDTFRGGFVSSRHKNRAALIDFEFKDCIYDSLNLSELGLRLFRVLLDKPDDSRPKFAVFRLEIIL